MSRIEFLIVSIILIISGVSLVIQVSSIPNRDKYNLKKKPYNGTVAHLTKKINLMQVKYDNMNQLYHWNSEKIESLAKDVESIKKGSLKRSAKDSAKLLPQTKNSKGYTPGLDGTYAQNYQDTWFERVTKHNGWKSGFYMDLGAFKPLECSNTAMLDIKYGWSGICVEPRPDIDFKSTRNCVLVNRPMTGRTNDEVWMSSPQGKNYDPNSQLYNIRNKGVGQRMMTINAPDLIALVNKDSRISVPKFIEFVSLDVEDNEDTVLSTWPWEEYTVAVFIIENYGNSQKAKSVRKTMLEQKYFKAPVENPGVDEYWILPKFWDNSLSYKRWRIHPENSNGC